MLVSILSGLSSYVRPNYRRNSGLPNLHGGGSLGNFRLGCRPGAAAAVPILDLSAFPNPFMEPI